MVSCPTGALTNKRVVGTELGTGDVVNPGRAFGLAIFQNVSGTFLELNQKAIVKRHYRTGRSSAARAISDRPRFIILEGKAEVYLSSPIAHVKTQDSGGGFFKRLSSLLTPRVDDQRAEESTRAFIPIDASVDLPYGSPVAELVPGDLFGEMTCMNYYPRSATVRAKTDCVNAGNASECPRHFAAQQNISGATGTQLPGAGAGFASAERADILRR